MYEKKSWLKFYGGIPESIDYPRVTMYEALMQTVSRCPDDTAKLKAEGKYCGA